MARTPISDLLKLMVDECASDLHLTVNAPPVLRIDGGIVRLELPSLGERDTSDYVHDLCSQEQLRRLAENGTADFAHAVEGLARFRVSAYIQRGSYALAVRLIPLKMLSPEEIGLPPAVRDLLALPRGLVLVTGPTGSGKSTTLASMLNEINTTMPSHIVTIEDPIEYYHEHRKGIVNQREVGADVPRFAEALKRALRQDPDVILVGEMRDPETIETAITAAETGHLVFSTLHTTGASRTVDRIIDSFPQQQQSQIRIQLAGNLRAVLSQLLLPRRDRPGRVAAFELMVHTPSIASLIRDNKTYRIANDILTGAKHGMVSLEASLAGLYRRGLISEDDVYAKSQDPELARQMIREGGGAR